ncbi:MAG: hypothetical protein ACI9DC_002540 [Gammaproteobacteria bacterium]|jgi:hypothetical protein
MPHSVHLEDLTLAMTLAMTLAICKRVTGPVGGGAFDA